MPALFRPGSNGVMRRTLLAIAVVIVAVPLLLMAWVRTPLVTREGDSPAQPVPFDHRIHAHALRIDCRYCHSDVERSAVAGMPSTQTCVPCHNQTWFNGPQFAPVRQSLASGRPIPWRRVNGLPDFVFFNHAVHVNGGVGCETCHGQVDRMARVKQAAPLTMAWCIDCHRNPNPRLRPVAEMTAMGWDPHAGGGRGDRAAGAGGQLAARTPVVSDERIREITNCSACHR
ncbi:MAG TPA: cytochrome c3 family protein [Gemmatimonadales bacterium]|nr:cytochrome c3 family protein [Gemmatimonadales bacterium]